MLAIKQSNYPIRENERFDKQVVEIFIISALPHMVAFQHYFFSD